MYIKSVELGDIIIVCLYIDDLIFTGSNLKMIAKFRETMVKHFEMIDLGLMSYFLGIKVVQTNGGVFISQKKYAIDILKKFQIKNSKPVSTPIEQKLKLIRGDKEKL